MAQNKPKSFSSYGKNSNRNSKHGKSTVNLAGMVTHRFREEYKTIHLEKLEEVETYCQNNPVGGPVKSPWHEGSSTINNVETFIEGHAGRVRGLAGKANLAGPYLRRMVQLMEWHQKAGIKAA